MMSPCVLRRLAPAASYAGPARATPRAEQRAAEADAAGGWVHIALVGRRVVGLDLQHDEGGAVAVAQHPAALGELALAGERAGALDAGTGGDPLEIDAEAGVALLVTGLAVMAIVDDEDRQVRRVQHRDRR